MSGRQLLRGITRCLEQLLAPGVCCGCGCDPGSSSVLCTSCQARIHPIPNPCQHCGQPNPLAGIICPACRLNPPRWQKMIAPLQYQGITRDYLLQLKHTQATHLAKGLCRHTLAAFRQNWPRPQVLLPVPLHRERLLERGYNQAREIARIWSADLDIPVDRHALTRTRATALQSGLSANQRAQNVRLAFTYSPRQAYRHVAVIDDIVTTGSTVDEITRQLHQAGVEFVEIWALARAYRR
ncbi:MAG: ComF family protein [Gammaproteobacteria bacterium]|jgi:ComF family protein|nr:ComF family protein [Gammaproteobacteria bacterium]